MLNGDAVIRRKRFRRRGSKEVNSKKRREKSPKSGTSHRPLGQGCEGKEGFLSLTVLFIY